MFGLNLPTLGIAAAGYALAAALGWAAWHEHGVAVAQAARDQASIAQVQATATAAALKQQQAIDAHELAKANKMRQQAEQAVMIAHQTMTAALAHAAASQQTIRTIIRSEPAAACARQPIPLAIVSQLEGWATTH